MFVKESWPEPTSCDVSDRSSLANMQTKLLRWKTMLAGDDPHSIEQQMLSIVSDDIDYRSFNEALRINKDRDKANAAPGLIIDLLHRTFFLSQAMGIRKLLDPKASSNEKSVYSLRTIISDIRSHYGLITRENYICYDGTWYNETDSRHDNRSKLKCSVRHKVFDTISTDQKSKRNRKDTIDVSLLDQMEKYLQKSNRLESYINKYIAHAADPLNRKKIELELKNVSLNYLQRLYKVLIWSANLLGKITDQLVLTEVPTPQFDQFQGWENGIILPRQKKHLYRYWSNRVDIFRRWSISYWHTEIVYRSPFEKLR